MRHFGVPSGFAIGPKISRGLSGRLNFDVACHRRQVFSETYFYGLLMELLASYVSPTNSVVRVGHALDVLQHPNRNRGRLREVDFAITSTDPVDEVQAAIEVKWAGSTHATAENILIDLVRLSLIQSAHPAAKCFFVLAGKKKDVETLFTQGLLRDDRSALADAYQEWLTTVERIQHERGEQPERGTAFLEVPVHAPHRPPTPLRRWNARKRHNQYLLGPLNGQAAPAPATVLDRLEAEYPQYPFSISTAFSDVPGALDNPWPVLVWRVLPNT